MSDNYVTPRWLTMALGPFDLDPCGGITQPWWHASRTITPETGDGLHEPWIGRVWLNPPYSKPHDWIANAAQCGNAVCIVNVCPTTAWWKTWVWGTAHAVRFLDKRIRFYLQDGTEWVEKRNPERDSVLVAWGARNVATLLELDENADPLLAGETIVLRRPRGHVSCAVSCAVSD